VELSVKLLFTWQDMQGVGVGETCSPVKANPVVAWSNVAVVKLTVVWQLAQFATANNGPAEAWGGALVPCQPPPKFVFKWQPEFPQSVGAIFKA